MRRAGVGVGDRRDAGRAVPSRVNAEARQGKNLRYAIPPRQRIAVGADRRVHDRHDEILDVARDDPRMPGVRGDVANPLAASGIDDQRDRVLFRHERSPLWLPGRHCFTRTGQS